MTTSNSPAPGAPITPTDVRALIAEQMPTVRQDLGELVAFPSVHSTPGLEEANASAAAWVVEAFRAAGVNVEPVTTSDGSITVIGHRPAAEGYPTILLYSHYDVQPAGDTAEWTSDPWTLTEREGRWYGRGTADCKGHVAVHLAVLRALQALADGGHPELRNLGLRIVVEGSEERGGYGLEDLLAERPELFAAETFLIADSGNDALGEPAVCTALRGSCPVQVTLKTIAQPMHSGQFGGAAPDALLELIRLLGTLHDEDGLVAVEGLTPTTHWEGAGPTEATFRDNAGVLNGVDVLGTDRNYAPNDLTVANASITVTGLDSLSVADAINAVPGAAAAVISLRVPPGRDPKECQDLLVAHLERNRPNALMEIERLSTAEPFSADTSGPALQRLMTALADVYDKPTAEVASGGSIPLTNKLLTAYPEAELALYGIEEPSCRIHSADESVHPEEIAAIAAAELLFLARTAADVCQTQ
ncbi:dipeptidase [Corynebacterium heidelbergense]|uniref:Dipeptidase n=1 Tax=Corynebacterium heidelbergense TaxID=2055947 RepID=A0A364VC05_9CORY|nr:dipeptidase [Corynebacterium heidelbergense]RAV34179.1 dipeptidase [Corynebacterium heidelbergense]WCZ35860.1 Acetylornithine deacetylase [Corynebacterium heidelbergense]